MADSGEALAMQILCVLIGKIHELNDLSRN